MIEFVVLTGFLGSGKTTLLRDALAGPMAAETAVIVNEAGEIGLDGAILREGAGDIPMALLANGCVCCQAGNDLVYTIDALLRADRPGTTPLRRIVLETSGLAKPGPVLRQLAGLAGLPLRVAVLATFDAGRGTAVAAFAEAAAQWAAANRIVATKLDLVPGAMATWDRRGVLATIAALNPLAEVVAEPDRARAVAAAFAPLGSPAMAMPDITGPPPGHNQVSVRLARPAQPLAYDDLATWLDNLAGALGERLLRLKGVVPVEGAGPMLIQSVGTLFAPPRRFAAASPLFLVVIALDLAPGELEAVPPSTLFRFPRQRLQASS